MFADVTSSVEQEGLPDGMKVDAAGNLFATGPAACLVFAPTGPTSAPSDTGEATANCAWGEDGSRYITADMYIGRIGSQPRERVLKGSSRLRRKGVQQGLLFDGQAHPTSEREFPSRGSEDMTMTEGRFKVQRMQE